VLASNNLHYFRWIMNDIQTETFADVLATILNRPIGSWIFLPRGEDWSLESEAVTLMSEEVPPEDEDLPDAGVPEFAKQRGLIQVMDVAALQDVVLNLLSQQPNANIDEVFRAFIHYYRQDAFIQI